MTIPFRQKALVKSGENCVQLRNFIHVYSQVARADNPQGDKILIITKMFYYFNHTLLVSAISLSYTERKKKRRVNFIPKFHSSLKKFVKYFTMITKRYMYGTKVPNFIGL